MGASIGTGMAALAIAGVVISVVTRLLPQRHGTPSKGNSKANGEYAVATQKDIRDLDLRISEMHNTLLEKIDASMGKVHERLDAREERCNERGQRIARVEQQAMETSDKMDKHENFGGRRMNRKTDEDVGYG